MKAVVLAGGEGVRLRPLTCDMPKPMAPLFDRPLCAYMVDLLRTHGFCDLTFTVMYKARSIEEYFGDGSGFGVCVDYSREIEPLGTAGSVKKAALANEAFLVISGDALTDINLSKAAAFHRETGAMATLVLKKMDAPQSYGIVSCSREGEVTGFLEKPEPHEIISDAVNTGIYILEPEVLELIPEGCAFDFAKDVFPKMLERGMRVSGYLAHGYWCDIGNIESYLKAHEDALKGACRISMPGSCDNGVYVGRNAKISASAIIQSPAYVGGTVDDGAQIGMYTAVLSGAYIGRRCNIKRSVVHGNARVMQSAKLTGALVLSGAYVGPKCSVFEGAVVGRSTTLEGDNKVSPRVRIWPEKWVEKSASVNENIVFGQTRPRDIFADGAVEGEINRELTPSALANVGCAIASAFDAEAKVAVAWEAECEAAARSVIAGLCQAGARVYEAGGGLPEVMRFCAGKMGMSAGVFASFAPDADEEARAKEKSGFVRISVYDGEGGAVSKERLRKMRNAYDNCDFHYPPPEAIVRPKTLVGMEEMYIHDVKSYLAGYGKFAVFGSGGERERIFIAACDERMYDYYPSSALANARDIVGKGSYCFGVSFPGAGRLNVYTGGGGVADGYAYEALIYCHAMYTLKELLYVPPLYLDRLLSFKTGARLVECDPCETCQNPPEVVRSLYDPLYFFSRLARWYADDGVDLDEIIRKLNLRQVKKRVFPCDAKSLGAALNAFLFSHDNAKCLSGVTYRKGEGTAVIAPSRLRPEIEIVAQGMNAEAAREICDFVYDELKKNAVDIRGGDA